MAEKLGVGESRGTRRGSVKGRSIILAKVHKNGYFNVPLIRRIFQKPEERHQHLVRSDELFGRVDAQGIDMRHPLIGVLMSEEESFIQERLNV